MIKTINVEDNRQAVCQWLNHSSKKTEAVSAFSNQEQLSLAFFDNQDQLGGLIGKRTGNTIHIQLLAVNPDHQNQGIGKQLIQALFDYGKKAGCRSVTVTTQDYQAPHFYQAAGFETFGVLSDTPVLGTDKLYFVKML
ncbi:MULTISPECIES: GNAT family N-acetyltransferase [unclassified Enterococcus]|uniref:GNAT family N-acetyltransferase n=1 Tax=unclassified Enterococcus TaxID=2608891 RepID=UPI000BBCFAB9|nr:MULTISPECIES: GNAT family N-acetyltransferase [unclassified Enterococcus]ATF73366.1 GNAT family N-acetyltransferase [Enterococcus sp. FDAARGOS_375]HAB95350.1 N-acetyltransferase [Enterococcus sp.]